MTTPYLENYLTSYKGIRNFGSDSYRVLRALLDANDELTLESDEQFLKSIVDFVNNPDNIWAKRSGEYVISTVEIEEQRALRINQIAVDLNIDVSKVDSLITRIYNSLVRHLRVNKDFSGAIENSRRRLARALKDVESES